MATVNESLDQSPLAADLRAGVEAISQQQEVTFTRYLRLVLPLDGYVFWVRSDLVNYGAMFNGMPLNARRMSQAPVTTPATFLEVRGSLHRATTRVQEEAETYAVNRLTFTSLSEVQEFEGVDPDVLYLADYEGVRFAFSARGNLYRPQADLYHYTGAAVYADMSPQIIDQPGQLDARQVVSNSLPIWLSLNTYAPLLPQPRPALTLYPSFLPPANLPPPYGVVHIDGTEAIQAAPQLAPDLSHSQLCRESCRVTLWGLRNEDALGFLDFVNQFTLDTDLMGVLNFPVPRDEKRTQSELGTIAQKKVMDFEVNYDQYAARAVARGLILSAPLNFTVSL